MGFSLTLPNIEDRFLPPENWEIKHFKNPNTKHDIAYRAALITNPKGTVIILPGLSEYGEKYIETTKQLNNNGFNVFIIDWIYQGLSTRFVGNRFKRHSNGYDADINDLDYFLKNEVKVNTPLYMLAHSMGGHLGLRYIHENPNVFKAAAMTTPMFSISALKYFCFISSFIFALLKNTHNNYVLGGKDWSLDNRVGNGKDKFSSDPIRDNVHEAWLNVNKDLQVGNPTNKWLSESLKSICILKNRKLLKSIETPVLFAAAGKEKLVDNSAIVRAAKLMPNAQFQYFKKSKHEILMETDDIRDKFIEKAFTLFNQK